MHARMYCNTYNYVWSYASQEQAGSRYGTRSPIDNSELQMQLFIYNCMYISMS